jgi:hypothetical protein
MVQFFPNILVAFRVFVRSPADTALEILALRQQLAVLQRKRLRPPWNGCDRLFWTILRRLWSGYGCRGLVLYGHDSRLLTRPGI